MHIDPWQMYPLPIDHRSPERHFTESVSDIEEYTYTYGRHTPQNEHRSLEHHYTESVPHIEECT